GDDAHELHAVAVDLLPHAVADPASRGPVDDKAYFLGARIQLPDHLRQAAGGLNAPAGADADQDEDVHIGQDAPAHVRQTRLVVHHDVAVVLGVLGYLGGEQAVDKAVAALALGPAHDQQVKVVGLGEGLAEAHLGVVGLGHARGDGADGGHLRPGDVLPDVAQGGLDLHPQHLGQIGIGVGVHGQDRTVL